MGFFEFLLLASIAYLAWRISDQLPDLLFRISEIQRDVADIRKQVIAGNEAKSASKPPVKRAPRKRASPKIAKSSTPENQGNDESSKTKPTENS
ncbi:MAG: hypothetical protein KUG75_11635 [Pseudomonadales bacterium]|nr:hypothetical protein [Pseudomonadales bacterium]